MADNLAAQRTGTLLFWRTRRYQSLLPHHQCVPLSFRCVVSGRYEVEPNLKANAIRRNAMIERSRLDFLTLRILSQSYGNSLPQSRQAT